MDLNWGAWVCIFAFNLWSGVVGPAPSIHVTVQKSFTVCNCGVSVQTCHCWGCLSVCSMHLHQGRAACHSFFFQGWRFKIHIQNKNMQKWIFHVRHMHEIWKTNWHMHVKFFLRHPCAKKGFCFFFMCNTCATMKKSHFVPFTSVFGKYISTRLRLHVCLHLCHTIPKKYCHSTVFLHGFL